MARSVSRVGLVLMMGLVLIRVGDAQADAAKVEFEVVSIKPFNPDLSQGGISRSTRNFKGRWEARNIRLKELLMSAFRVNENQIVGGPKWLDSASWDIDATYPDGNQRQFSQMLQAMLADRFHLVFHRETRTLSIYLLEVAKNGPKLKESTATTASMSAGQRMIKYSRATMSELVDQLSSYFGRQVLDQTELKGQYEINLRFAPVDRAGYSILIYRLDREGCDRVRAELGLPPLE